MRSDIVFLVLFAATAASIPTSSRINRFCLGCILAKEFRDCRCCESNEDCPNSNCIRTLGGKICSPCLKENVFCERDKDCCSGNICKRHRCKRPPKPGLLESPCKSHQDCNAGLCCAKDFDSEGYICKEMSKVLRQCSTSGSIEEYWCSCRRGLTCSGRETKFWKSFIFKFLLKKQQICLPDRPENLGFVGQESGSASGDQESGDQESGDQESGDQESGDQESGDQESGDQESGDQESGDQESGDQESGDQESGGQESGDQESGGQESGGQESGDQESGHQESGDQESKSKIQETETSPSKLPFSFPDPELNTLLTEIPSEKRTSEDLRLKKFQQKEIEWKERHEKNQAKLERLARIEEKEKRRKEKLQRGKQK